MQYSLEEVLFMVVSNAATSKAPMMKPIRPIIQYFPLPSAIALFPKIL